MFPGIASSSVPEFGVAFKLGKSSMQTVLHTFTGQAYGETTTAGLARGTALRMAACPLTIPRLDAQLLWHRLQRGGASSLLATEWVQAPSLMNRYQPKGLG